MMGVDDILDLALSALVEQGDGALMPLFDCGLIGERETEVNRYADLPAVRQDIEIPGFANYRITVEELDGRTAPMPPTSHAGEE